MNYFIKRNDNDFVINIDLMQKNSGYNVVPKAVDPWNAYDIAEVQAYAQANPGMEVLWSDEQGKYVPMEATK